MRVALIITALLTIAIVLVVALGGGEDGRVDPVTLEPNASGSSSRDTAPAGIAGLESVELASPGSRAAQLGAEPGEWDNEITGTVLDPRGTPIAGAQVALAKQLPKGASLFDFIVAQGEPIDEARYRAETDAAGRFRLEGIAPAEMYLLFARHEAYSTAKVGPFPVGPEDSLEKDLRFLPGKRLFGFVTDENQRSLQGALMTLREGSIVNQFGPQEAQTRTALTDATGHYEFEHVAGLDYTLEVEAEGYGGFNRQLRVPRDVPEHQEDFQLSVGQLIRGHVADDNGQPVPGASVTAYRRGSTSDVSTTEVLADDGGEFRFTSVPVGDYALRATADGYDTTDVRRVTAGADQEPVPIVIRKLGGVRGRVVDAATGRPVRSFRVMARAAGRARHSSLVPRSSGGASHRNSTDGAFEILGLPAGKYGLQVYADGYAMTITERFQVDTPHVTEGVEVRLTRGGRIRGMVLGSDGAPLAGARVRSLPNQFLDTTGFAATRGEVTNVTEATVHSGKDGSFELEMLRPADYQVRVEHDAHALWWVLGVSVGDGEAVDIGLVKMQAGSILTGTVFDGSGRPIPDAEVFLTHSEIAFRMVKLKTDSSGRYRAEELMPGPYVVQAAASAGFGKIDDIHASEVRLELISGREHVQDLSISHP